MKKLHLGCGGHVLPGWLNTDLRPRSSEVVKLDATAPFPFDSGSFDYVFSEHMIEHVTHAQGLGMLKECRRVLRAGGKLRVATPDLAFLIDLYREPKTPLQLDYIGWATQRFIPSAPGSMDTFVINNFVRDWGHQFIYDEKVLRLSMQTAGFEAIVRCELSRSEDAELRDLEREERMPPGFLRLESMVLEGRKGGA